MPVPTLVTGMFVSAAVIVMRWPMLAIRVATAMARVIGGRCAFEMSVDAMIAIVAMVDGDSVARYA